MSEQITNYKCPSCMGPLHYAAEAGKLACDYCGSEFELAAIEALYGGQGQRERETKKSRTKKTSKDDYTQEETEWGSDTRRMRSYSCPACGAELICEETTSATSCPYCGNPAVIPGQFTGKQKPDYILPFQLEKEKAVEALKRHYKGKFLLPRTFSNQNHIQEIKGVYVPFWLFDADAEVDAIFQCTRSRTHENKDERVTVTEHFNAYRSGTVDFRRVPVDGSSRMPDEYMDSIEPFDYSGLKPFSMSYLPGYLADQYDQTAKQCAARADQRMSNSAVDAMRDTVRGYETVVLSSQQVNLKRGSVKYALLPVWMLSTNYRGKNYLFAMNGQTGKLVGDLPVDRTKYWLMTLVLTFVSAGLLCLTGVAPAIGAVIRDIFL